MTRTPSFGLTPEDLRAVTTFAHASAAEVLPLFLDAVPDDPRPAEAVAAAAEIVAGGRRTVRQRRSGPAAHRAAREAPTPVAFHAAMAAGDAAASVYLHPLADATQVGHILRASAHAACAVAGHRPEDGGALERSLSAAAARATPRLIEVLSRYPVSAEGTQPVTRAMHRLDLRLREPMAEG